MPWGEVRNRSVMCYLPTQCEVISKLVVGAENRLGMAYPGRHRPLLTGVYRFDSFRHEQAYLSSEIRKLGILKFWPDEWCPSFKYHCVPPWPKSWYQTPRIPENSRVIIFHGVPNPPDALIGESGKWWRLIRPSPWLEKYWTE